VDLLCIAGVGASYESRGMARGLSWLRPGSLGGDTRTLGWRVDRGVALTAHCSQPKGVGQKEGQAAQRCWSHRKKMTPG